jgi:hypothetical protein
MTNPISCTNKTYILFVFRKLYPNKLKRLLQNKRSPKITFIYYKALSFITVIHLQSVPQSNDILKQGLACLQKQPEVFFFWPHSEKFGFRTNVDFEEKRFSLTSHREAGSSVSILSGYGLGERAIEVRSPAEAKGFFL